MHVVLWYYYHKTFEGSTLQIHITDQAPLESQRQEACGFPVIVTNVLCACAQLPS